MSATGWKIAKVTLITGAVVGGLGAFVGTDNAANMTHTAVVATAWGIGTAGSSVKDAVPALQGALKGGNYQPFTSAPPSTQPQPKAHKKKAPPKVPNCTAKQKKAAPASCA